MPRPAVTDQFPWRSWPSGRGVPPGIGAAPPESQSGRLLPDKGKPIVRWGRKATGQATCLTARLSKEGYRELSELRGSTAKGDSLHDLEAPRFPSCTRSLFTAAGPLT